MVESERQELKGLIRKTDGDKSQKKIESTINRKRTRDGKKLETKEIKT